MPHDFDPAHYPPAVAALLQPVRECELDAGAPNEAARPMLIALNDNDLTDGRQLVDRQLAAACRAGLWLLHDGLDESHRISQEIETSTGSFWHAVMHRREGDYSNAKYWFRRVGQHPTFDSLAKRARRLADEHATALDQSTRWLADVRSWDPYRFVAACEAAVGGQSSAGPLLQRVQHAEWELLFDYCYQGAIATPQPV